MCSYCNLKGQHKEKVVCLLLISIKDYLKLIINDRDGFSLSKSCLVLEIFVFNNTLLKLSCDVIYSRIENSSNFCTDICFDTTFIHV